MFESITTPLKVEARVVVYDLMISIVVAVSTVVGLGVTGIAIFYATYKNYGGLIASLAEIGYALLVMAAAVSILLVSRGRARKRAAARAEEEEMERRQQRANAPPIWRDPGVLIAALPLLGKFASMTLRNKKAAGGLAGGITAGFALWQAIQARTR